MMLKKQSLLCFSLVLLVSLLYSTTTLAQLSPASAPVQPAQPPPTTPAASPKPLVPSLPQSPSDSTPDIPAAVDIVGILRKAKSFNVALPFLHLMTAPSQNSKQDSSTLFLMDQKLELLQFHVISDYVSSSNFDTLTNPVRTLAGAKPGKVELNVISYGGSVNISTGELLRHQQRHHSLAPEPSADTAKAPKDDKDTASSSDSSTQVNPTEENSGSVNISVYGKWVSLGLALVAAMMQN
ncbi:FAS1 domain superfamily [Sesbania bispinosa]|nr:FAS1 domain superfamily [Sesbania bispinosa]